MNKEFVRIISIGIIVSLIFTTVIGVIPLITKATPESYIYYDTFDRTGPANDNWTAAYPSKETYSTEQHYSGTKSLKFASTGDGNSLSIYRWFSNNTPSTFNGVSIQTMMYVISSNINNASFNRTNLFVANLADTVINVGQYNAISSNYFVYWYTDNGGAMNYVITSRWLNSGWHTFRIDIINNLNFNIYIDTVKVGSISITFNYAPEYYGVYLKDENGIPQTAYYDNFAVILDATAHIDTIKESTNPVLSPSLGWESTAVIESSVFKAQNGTYFGWYRGNLGDGPSNSYIGYMTSTDGITWNKRSTPILSGWVFPYVVIYHNNYYLFVSNLTTDNIYLFNVTNHISPVIMNGGLPVYYHSVTPTDWDYMIYNVGVAIVDNTWYMMIEGRTSTSSFRIGIAYSTFSELNWTIHRQSNVLILSAGNPYITYVSDRNSLLMIYGSNQPGYWITSAAYASLNDNVLLASSWTVVPTSTFVISDAPHHVCDPDMIISFNSTYGVAILYGVNQTDISQEYFVGTLNEFFDALTGVVYIPVADTSVNPAMFILLIIGFSVAFIAIVYTYIENVKNKSIEEYITNLVYILFAVVISFVIVSVAAGVW